MIMCSLTENWVNAVKYEQMYMDWVKESKMENKESLVTESTKRLQEYNQKLVLKMSMRSILG